MSAQFTIIKKLIPGKDGVREKYCAAVVKRKIVSLEEIAVSLSEASTLNAIDCYAVMMGMSMEIARHLSEGNVVNIENLGSFRLSAKSQAVDNISEVTDKTISNPSVNFRPAVVLKNKLRKIKFEKKIQV